MGLAGLGVVEGRGGQQVLHRGFARREVSGELSLCASRRADSATSKYVNVQGVARLHPLATELLETLAEKYLPRRPAEGGPGGEAPPGGVWQRRARVGAS
jgi:hypothetical protein